MLALSSRNQKCFCRIFLLVLAGSLLSACQGPQDVSPVDWSFARAGFEQEGRSLDELDKVIAEFEEQEYVDDFGIDEIHREFPIQPGMSVAEVENIATAMDENWDYDTRDQVYNLGWGAQEINAGDGWMYYWVNGKALFHVNLTIQNGTVQSVWVMPGNAEYVTSIYYRISGHGPRIGPNDLYPKRE